MRGHLDAAGCDVPSDGVLGAMVEHLRRERELGGYAAAPDLTETRADLAALAGAGPHEVAFLESGTAAMAALLGGWRLAPGSRVGHTRAEYGSTLALLRHLAAERDWKLVELPVDDEGRLDPGDLRSGLELVVLSHLGSHRGLVQPAARIGAACRAAGIPLVLDVCQSLGHVEVRGTGASAYVGTSRKWLGGPRGVGFLIVPGLTPAMRGHPWNEPAEGALRYESWEAGVAARVGLGVAVREHHARGPAAVHAALADLGRTARGLLDGAGGWRVAEPLDEPSALVTLRPPPHDTVEHAAARAAAASLVVNVVPPRRAPLDLREPVLRVSPSFGTPVETLEELARVLSSAGASALG